MVHRIPPSKWSVLGVLTAAALIQMQCRFMGPCTALNMHSTLVWVIGITLYNFLMLRVPLTDGMGK